jgi:hypothetical protein
MIVPARGENCAAVSSLPRTHIAGPLQNARALPRWPADGLSVRGRSLVLRGCRALRLLARWLAALAHGGVRVVALGLFIFALVCTFAGGVIMLPAGITWVVSQVLGLDPSPGSQWSIQWEQAGAAALVALVLTLLAMFLFGPVLMAETLALRGLAPLRFTADDIRAEQNVAIRRVMLDRLGVERFIVESRARPLQEDQEYGSLFRVAMADDEPLVVVRVRDATPAADGMFREYWLRVPPHVQSARAAVAWSFGKDPDQYAPQVQT